MAGPGSAIRISLLSLDLAAQGLARDLQRPEHFFFQSSQAQYLRSLAASSASLDNLPLSHRENFKLLWLPYLVLMPKSEL